MSDGAAPNRCLLMWMGVVVAVMTVAAGAMFFALSPRYLPEPPPRDGSERAPEEIVATPVTPAPVAAAPEAEPQPEPEPPEADVVEAPVDAGAPDTPTPAPRILPSVDVVRVERDGRALVAGSAEPGARIAIMSDNEEVGVAEADASGDFVAIFTAEPSSEPQSLSVEAEGAAGGVARSEDVVVLLPEAAAPEPEREVAAVGDGAEEVAEAGAPPPAWVDAAGAVDAPTEEIAAVAIVRSDGVEATPLARPIGADPRTVALASISYGETGDVALSGFGAAGGRLRAYVDDDFAREALVDADGRWEIGLGDVDEGLYTLRIDAVGEDGRVESRLETPFQRDMPRARPGGTDGSVVVVQPGTNLWTLARIHYGSGVLYTQIFTANRELIRDPNLIYPGQIFALPEAGSEN